MGKLKGKALGLSRKFLKVFRLLRSWKVIENLLNDLLEKKEKIFAGEIATYTYTK